MTIYGSNGLHSIPILQFYTDPVVSFYATSQTKYGLCGLSVSICLFTFFNDNKIINYNYKKKYK